MQTADKDIADNPVIRWLLLGLGTVCVALGILGIFLPLLPTTPFLLVAAACYARSSTASYQRLVRNRWVGKYIEDYRNGRGVPRRAKLVAISLLWLSMGGTLAFAAAPEPVKGMLLLLAFGVTIYLIRLPGPQCNAAEQDTALSPAD